MGSDQSVNLISSMEEVTGTDIISRGDNVVIHLCQRVFCWVLNKSHFCLLESCAQVMTVCLPPSDFKTCNWERLCE